MRVLIADNLPEAAREHLLAHGCDVVMEPSLKGQALALRMAEFDPQVLIVRSTKVKARHITGAGHLALIVRAGAGVNSIDVQAASTQGVYVANCPGKNAAAVAELTMGLVLAVDRHIPDAVADLRAGRWNKKTWSKARGLRGRTFGVLGVGGIGTEVIHLAKAFGMHVVAWSRSLSAERANELGVTRCKSPAEVARHSSIVSVHLALTDETAGLVDDAVFDEMNPGEMFINTCRAQVVDEGALLRALDRGVRAGLDVFTAEPSSKQGPWEHPIAQHANVVGTHHIGASTTQAQTAVADEACRIVLAFKDTGDVDNCLNVGRRGGEPHTVVVRHLDKVGVLAAVLLTLREEGISVGHMSNLIFDGDTAAVARIHTRGELTSQAMRDLATHPDILSVSCVDNQRRTR